MRLWIPPGSWRLKLFQTLQVKREKWHPAVRWNDWEWNSARLKSCMDEIKPWTVLTVSLLTSVRCWHVCDQTRNGGLQPNFKLSLPHASNEIIMSTCRFTQMPLQSYSDLKQLSAWPHDLVIFLLDWGVKKRALLCAQMDPKSEKKGRALKFQTKTENYQHDPCFFPTAYSCRCILWNNSHSPWFLSFRKSSL
jgi:hypothetical protein